MMIRGRTIAPENRTCGARIRIFSIVMRPGKRGDRHSLCDGAPVGVTKRTDARRINQLRPTPKQFDRGPEPARAGLSARHGAATDIQRR